MLRVAKYKNCSRNTHRHFQLTWLSVLVESTYVQANVTHFLGSKMFDDTEPSKRIKIITYIFLHIDG